MSEYLKSLKIACNAHSGGKGRSGQYRQFSAVITDHKEANLVFRTAGTTQFRGSSDGEYLILKPAPKEGAAFNFTRGTVDYFRWAQLINDFPLFESHSAAGFLQEDGTLRISLADVGRYLKRCEPVLVVTVDGNEVSVSDEIRKLILKQE